MPTIVKLWSVILNNLIRFENLHIFLVTKFFAYFSCYSIHGFIQLTVYDYLPSAARFSCLQRYNESEYFINLT